MNSEFNNNVPQFWSTSFDLGLLKRCMCCIHGGLELGPICYFQR